MLKLQIPAKEFYDEENQKFIDVEGFTLELEHSLVSLSIWESKWEKPFLAATEKTTEETLDYILCMVLDPDFPPEDISRLSAENFQAINKYIDAKQTATWFSDFDKKRASSVTITAELIYYWMIGYNIPFECDKWHLNRLFTLIKVCSAKQEKPKKAPDGDALQKRRELNERRKAELGTQG